MTADYSSHEDLVSAFKGQDAVVSTVGAPALGDQIKLINAAIEAGVKYFIPSEFGGNTLNEKTAKLAVFGKRSLHANISRRKLQRARSTTL